MHLTRADKISSAKVSIVLKQWMRAEFVLFSKLSQNISFFPSADMGARSDTEAGPVSSVGPTITLRHGSMIPVNPKTKMTYESFIPLALPSMRLSWIYGSSGSHVKKWCRSMIHISFFWDLDCFILYVDLIPWPIGSDPGRMLGWLPICDSYA